MSEATRARRAEVSRDGTPPDDDPFARAEFKSLPLALSVRLADGSLLFGELTRLAAGSVIPLDTPVGEPSRLLAGDRPIAIGELVEIRGRLEFRVTRLGVDHG
ncbi:MAG: FliM/FliN family flagellar motor C-terminal domain-containing protein [Acidobacteriota bacterium]|nr:FliM/FliN family flagellar motor C-terminal domain-containing protein [Acidobacteriota bacterium]